MALFLPLSYPHARIWKVEHNVNPWSTYFFSGGSTFSLPLYISSLVTNQSEHVSCPPHVYPWRMHAHVEWNFACNFQAADPWCTLLSSERVVRVNHWRHHLNLLFGKILCAYWICSASDVRWWQCVGGYEKLGGRGGGGGKGKQLTIMPTITSWQTGGKKKTWEARNWAHVSTDPMYHCPTLPSPPQPPFSLFSAPPLPPIFQSLPIPPPPPPLYMCNCAFWRTKIHGLILYNNYNLHVGVAQCITILSHTLSSCPHPGTGNVRLYFYWSNSTDRESWNGQQPSPPGIQTFSSNWWWFQTIGDEWRLRIKKASD